MKSEDTTELTAPPSIKHQSHSVECILAHCWLDVASSWIIAGLVLALSFLACERKKRMVEDCRRKNKESKGVFDYIHQSCSLFRSNCISSGTTLQKDDRRVEYLTYLKCTSLSSCDDLRNVNEIYEMLTCFGTVSLPQNTHIYKYSRTILLHKDGFKYFHMHSQILICTPIPKAQITCEKDESKAHSPLHTHVAAVAGRPDGGGAVGGQASDARTFIGLRREGLG